jgi:hypothetical protein
MPQLALLPTGEALRPEDVKRVRIQPQPMSLEQEVRCYAVVIELTDGAPWALKEGLSLEEATSLSRRCSQAIKESLAGQ